MQDKQRQLRALTAQSGGTGGTLDLRPASSRGEGKGLEIVCTAGPENEDFEQKHLFLFLSLSRVSVCVCVFMHVCAHVGEEV